MHVASNLKRYITTSLFLLLQLAAPAAPGAQPSEVKSGQVGSPSSDQLADRGLDKVKLQLEQSLRDDSNTAYLIENKEAVDSFLAPVQLLTELADPDRLDWCCSFRNDYSRSIIRQVVHVGPGAIDTLDKACNRFSLKGRRARFYAVECLHAFTQANYPTMIWLEGRVGDSDGAICVKWYEPYLANRDLEFPLHPERCLVTWDPSTLNAYERHDLTPRATEFLKHTVPLAFNNPLQLYSVFDSLRLHSVSVAALQMSFDSRNSAQTPESPIVVNLLQNDKELRRTDVVLKDGQLESLTIQQSALQLVRSDSSTYSITKVTDNAPQSAEQFTPTVKVPYLLGGRRISITFGGAKDVPIIFEESQDNCVRFDAAITRLSYDNSPLRDGFWMDVERNALLEADHRLQDIYNAIDNHLTAWSPSPYATTELDECRDSGVLRGRLKYNVYAGLYRHEMTVVSDALTRYRMLISKEGVSMEMYVYSLEALTQASFEFFGDRTGFEVATGFLRDAYSLLTPAQRMRCYARLLHQYRYGFALAVLEAMRDARDVVPSGWCTHNMLGLMNQIDEDSKTPSTDPAFPYLPNIRLVNTKLKTCFGAINPQ